MTSRKYNAFALLAPLLLLCLSAAARTPSSRNAAGHSELRAFWVDGFNDGFHTPAECDTLLARARAAHLNALFVQVRKRGDAYYQSHYEPWATDDPQHFDALAYLCAQAHAPGRPRLQVHAWVNACNVSLVTPPNGFVRAHPDWLSLSDTGATEDGESYKIDPGNPAAADFTYRVYLDIVRHYAIDGIHFDFIRYGGSGPTAGHWGYNPVSVARFDARYGRTGQPLWDDPEWQAWRREQVTDLVRRVSVTAHALKPHLIVSAATICWGDGPRNDAEYEAKSASYTEVYAPWRDWLRAGLLDLNCPMTYFNLQKHPDYWQHWSDFVKDHQYGRLSSLGVGTWINTIPDSLAEIASTRRPTGTGNAAAGAVMFSYAGTDSVNGTEQQYGPALYGGLLNVFSSDAPPPPMPWLDHPTTGSVMGTALVGKELTPVDGMTITATAGGVTRLTSTDGNGFFAFLGLPPGDYHLDFRPRDAHEAPFTRFLAGVGVSTGSIGRPLLFIRPVPDYPNRFQTIQGIGRLREGSGLIFSNIRVSNGSDRLGDDFYVLDASGRWPLRVHAPGLSPPTVAGDLVAVSGTLHHTPGGPVLDATAVRQLGAALLP